MYWGKTNISRLLSWGGLSYFVVKMWREAGNATLGLFFIYAYESDWHSRLRTPTTYVPKRKLILFDELREMIISDIEDAMHHRLPY